MTEKAWDPEDIAGSTGLARKFIINVATSRAQTPEKYDRPVWVLTGEIELPDGERTDGDLRLSFGQKFEPGDDQGTFVIHQSLDPTKKVNENTSMMKFIKSMQGVPGSDALLKLLQERSRVLNFPEYGDVDLTSRDLTIWEGLRLSVDHVKEMRKNPQTGVEKEAEQPVIVEFLGTVDNPTASTGASAAGASGGSPASASNGTGSLSEDQAREIAKSHETYMKYLTDIVDNHGVDPGADVAKQEFYTAAKG